MQHERAPARCEQGSEQGASPASGCHEEAREKPPRGRGEGGAERRGRGLSASHEPSEA